MTRLRIGIVVALGLLAIAPSARAQFGNLPPGFGVGQFDPFSAYYGYYLPRNQAIAAQMAGGANEQINFNAQSRRASALNQRFEGGFDGQANPYEMIPIEQRNFVRPPTVLLPGQYSSPSPAGYFGRSTTFFQGARSGAPGATGGSLPASARLPQSRMGSPMMGMGGMGGVGGMGGFGGFGGGFQ